MPVFEYRCVKCDHKFEELVLGSKEQEVVCPKCGGKTKKLVSTFLARGGEGRVLGSTCSSCTATSCSTCGVK